MVIVRILVLVAIALLPSIEAAAQLQAIRFGKLVDGQGHVTDDAVVVVEEDRIRSVGTGDGAIPRGAAVIDLRPLTGIPGLIDVHTHLTYGPAEGRRERLPAESMFLGQDGALKTLESGVTTVRDMNAAEYTDIAMRRLINNGHMVGPRMLVVGYGLSVTRSRTGPPVHPDSGLTRRGPPHRPAQHRCRSRLDQGVRIDGQRSGCNGFPDVYLRGNESGRRCHTCTRTADRDPFLWSRRSTRRRPCRSRFTRACDRYG